MTEYNSFFSFTGAGLDAYSRVFTGDLDDAAIDLGDPSLVTRVPGTGRLVITRFEAAADMADAVLAAIGKANLFELLHDTGLWAWLTFVMRDQLFKQDSSGQWRVGESHRWYPSDPNDWQKGQRHLVRMPVLLRASLGENADHLLCAAPSVLPEIREQLTSQQDMFNPAFQQVARALYFDDEKGGLKRGAGGKGAGSPRRLAKVRQQLDVTWDLQDLDPKKIIGTLPREFDRYKPRSPVWPSRNASDAAPLNLY